MAWEEFEPILKACPCGKGSYAVIQRSDDWGRVDEGWRMHCKTCASKYELYSHEAFHKGLKEPHRGWVLRSVLKRHFTAAATLERRKSQLTTHVRRKFQAMWYSHFEGKTAKAVWCELTRNGKADPCSSLSTFYTHIRNVGIEEVLNGYFYYPELREVVRVLKLKKNSELAVRIVAIEQLEKELRKQESEIQRQMFD